MKDPVVASLPGSELSHPYSSIATSPDRSHAIVAGKDTLRVCSISALGLSELHSIRVAKVSFYSRFFHIIFILIPLFILKNLFLSISFNLT